MSQQPDSDPIVQTYPPLRIAGVVPNLDRIAAESMGTRLQGMSAARAELDHKFLILLAEFDAAEGWRHYDRIDSTAHWLGWSCSMAPGTAREQVRVARALVKLPEVSRLMSEGELTYSKVREISRLVPTEPSPMPVEESALCQLAVQMTASQLARTVRAYRHLPGKRIQSEAKRSLSWRTRDDGLCELRVLLPADEAATVRAAIETAQSAQRVDEQPNTPDQPGVDALLEVASTFLATGAQDTIDDHHLVSVLMGADVPAGTSDGAVDRCELVTGEGLETETARRFACFARVLGAVVNGHGEVLDLGRTRRVISKAQRRALGIRDHGCQFPDCQRRRWLQAHHIEHWIDGGETDLDNLMLLCHFHHKCVHEGGITIFREDNHWAFLMPDGTNLQNEPPPPDPVLLDRLVDWSLHQARRPDANRVFPPQAGAGFQLADCVGAMIAGETD